MLDADCGSQVNTFPLGFKVESPADLSDGSVLSKALGNIMKMNTLYLAPQIDLRIS